MQLDRKRTLLDNPPSWLSMPYARDILTSTQIRRNDLLIPIH